MPVRQVLWAIIRFLYMQMLHLFWQFTAAFKKVEGIQQHGVSWLFKHLLKMPALVN